ncbi:DUF3306 domain-containing protein [Polynucleobacter sp. AP-Jannik-300A-C4]|uniref:DUF3306 domain-containing protein n=1 Tax=Polynucleobacter sp. AP-Jannik-300A-C4 TaxID=2576928 RepID=UPI001BFEBABD|nr:DUF3306 domain-containing protein [Polynucleobacter sp. AP-Jannik-300A-C4]QWE21916.1 DUF3306 domain-containing protein [Polynucleobacter sp. AP-Jannik-300A-C4]
MESRFLSRWSRLKSGKAVQSEEGPAPSSQTADTKTSTDVQPPISSEEVKLPSLDDVEKIDQLAPDFSTFMQPGVDPEVQQAALKKMFSDPHFNIMDGLDEYIDDYSKPNPIPLAMLKRMAQSKMLSIFSENEDQAVPEIAHADSSHAELKDQDSNPAALANPVENRITSSTATPNDVQLSPVPMPVDKKTS